MEEAQERKRAKYRDLVSEKGVEGLLQARDGGIEGLCRPESTDCEEELSRTS